ncbi:MAG: cytochrome ubiquinol oxidase subunit I [Chloroflexota bacterium]
MAALTQILPLPDCAAVSGKHNWLAAHRTRPCPWVVYGLMKMEDAVSINVGIGALWTTLIGFTLLYGVLMVADLYLLVKYARKSSSKPLSQKSGEAAISLAGD